MSTQSISLPSKASPGILILVNVPWWNASAFYAVNIARILYERGHRVFLGCSKRYPAYHMARSKGVPTVDLEFYGKDPFRQITSFFRMLRFIRKKGVRIINSHRSEDDTYAVLAKTFTNTGVIITRGDQRPVSKNHLSRLRFRLADAIILTCKSIYHNSERIFQPLKNKVRVIYGSVDESSFIARQDSAQTSRKYCIDRNKIVVGFVGRFDHVKDPFTFVKAALLVLALRKDVVFVMAGKKSQLDPGAVDGALALDEMQCHFRFLPIIEDIADVVSLFDIAVITSIESETISRVLLEYLYLGKAVIGTPVNAVGEIIEPGVNGGLFDVNDYRGLAAIILKLCRDSDKRLEWAHNSAKRYHDRYSEAMFYNQYTRVLKGVTTQK